MTRRDMANWLCRTVTKRRLERIGEQDRAISPAPLDDLPRDEQENWLDMADAVITLRESHSPAERLYALAHDWEHYTLTIVDRVTRDEMRRAVVIEMRVEVERLWKECAGD